MATDKLINQTQGDDIIDALSDIATNVGNITYGPQTSADKVVSMTGYQKASAEAAISEGDTLNLAIGKLEKKADDNATAVAGKIDKLTNATAGDIATVTATGEIADSEVAIETALSDSSDAKVPTSKAVGTYVDGKGYAVGVNSSTANNLVAFNDANGKALKDSGISVAKYSTGLTDSDTAVPTSKTVKTYVDSTATGISRYIGTITAASQLSTSAKKGDFYIVKTAWSGVHAGDEIIAETNNPAQTIDGTNWSLLHNEADTDTKYTFATGDSNGTFKVTPSDTGTAQSVPIKGLGDAAYKGVATTVSDNANLVTAAAVNTKLASYVPNSDFVVALDANGQKNILYYEGLEKVEGGLTFKYDADGTITVNGTCSVSDTYAYIYGIYGYVTQGVEYSLIDPLHSNSNGCYAFVANTDAFGDARTLYSYETHYTSGATRKISIVMRFARGTVYNNIQLKPMICVKSLFDISPNYLPYSLPNTVITPELIELCDSGAKNLYDITSSAYIASSPSITYSKDSSKISVSSTANYTYVEYSVPATLSAGNYVLSFDITGYTGNTLSMLEVRTTSGTVIATTSNFNSNGNVTCNIALTSSSTIKLRICCNLASSAIAVSYNVANIMICTKAAFGVSSKFVPYRPNWDLVVSNLKKNTITHSTMNSSYNFHGFKITTGNRATGTAYFMGNGTQVGAGVISFSYTLLSSTPILYVDKKMVTPSYVKFYYVNTDTFYIVFYTSTKWDDISILGTFTADEVEEYFSNTEIPSGATQLTETAFPTV